MIKGKFLGVEQSPEEIIPWIFRIIGGGGLLEDFVQGLAFSGARWAAEGCQKDGVGSFLQVGLFVENGF